MSSRATSASSLASEARRVVRYSVETSWSVLSFMFEYWLSLLESLCCTVTLCSVVEGLALSDLMSEYYYHRSSTFLIFLCIYSFLTGEGECVGEVNS